MNVITYILLIFLFIGILGILVGCTTDDDGSTDYRWYVKIYMPDGIIEGPGRVINRPACGLITVEVDGIQYYVGSQNVFVTKLPTP